MPWPETDAVGSDVTTPVIVYGTAARTPDGELAHEGNRVPDVVALDARRLVVAWRAGLGDSRDPAPTDQGSIMYARSADGGTAWTVGTLAPATATHRYHYVIFLKDGDALYALLGRITVAEDRDASGDLDGFPVTMTAKRSLDGGVTWADFPIVVDVPGNARGVVVAGKPLRHDGVWLVPYWRRVGTATRAGVLRSTDLVTWTSGGLADNPSGVAVEEPQIAPSQDEPGAIVMVTRTLDLTGGTTPAERDAHYRANAAYCATATSRDGGLTWSPMRLDRELPNYYVKTFFHGDSAGRHLAIYNTFAGPFLGASATKPDRYREVLHYKVRRPGRPWEPGRLFADGPRLTRGAARGWDVYPSADEYEPGRFVVVWEHNQTNIKVAKLDISRPFAGGDLLTGAWTLTGGARIDAGVIRLRSTGPAPSHAWRPLDVSRGCDFTLEFRGRVDDDSALDPRTGAGVCLGAKVANGARRLMLAVQRGGVWTMRKGSSVWERVHPLGGAGGLATWRVDVDSAGVARLLRDGVDTGVTWVVQDSGERPQLAHWVTGTPGGNAAAATVEWTRLTPFLRDRTLP
ncbi:sialidase family protein [Streptosporangium saharense]|uniref:sialidase family protein n=1 Tax=Streptosporangium saharense TaxID=1706840 RepID=UPI0036BB70A1